MYLFVALPWASPDFVFRAMGLPASFSLFIMRLELCLLESTLSFLLFVCVGGYFRGLPFFFGGGFWLIIPELSNTAYEQSNIKWRIRSSMENVQRDLPTGMLLAVAPHLLCGVNISNCKALEYAPSSNADMMRLLLREEKLLVRGPWRAWRNLNLFKLTH